MLEQEEKAKVAGETESGETEKETGKQPISETWSQDAQDELQEFIELQGIYIRQ